MIYDALLLSPVFFSIVVALFTQYAVHIRRHVCSDGPPQLVGQQQGLATSHVSVLPFRTGSSYVTRVYVAFQNGFLMRAGVTCVCVAFQNRFYSMMHDPGCVQVWRVFVLPC